MTSLELVNILLQFQFGIHVLLIRFSSSIIICIFVIKLINDATIYDWIQSQNFLFSSDIKHIRLKFQSKIFKLLFKACLRQTFKLLLSIVLQKLKCFITISQNYATIDYYDYE